MAVLSAPVNVVSSTIATLVAASLATLFFVLPRTERSCKPEVRRRIIPSPRDTLLPNISPQRASTLPYSPNTLPGGRNVATPYGVMRVYEWGPEDGEKVVLIHGITTPGPMLGPVANGLVERGCRVMMFDLWGRGYTDTPLDVPHDAKLFGLQIMFAAASSSLSWTGAPSAGFSIVAFSLGGGIAMSFAAHFPYLVNSIVLLAPVGLIRHPPEGYESFCFRYPHLVPSSYMRKVVGRILGVDTKRVPVDEASFDTQHKSVVADAAGPTEQADLDIPAIVQWQFDYHKGFIHSFTSSAVYGPIMHQQSDWKKVCSIIRGDTTQTVLLEKPSKLLNGKILVIVGDTDGIVVAQDLFTDLSELIGGADHLDFKVVQGGHGFPVPNSEEVVNCISEFWGF